MGFYGAAKSAIKANMQIDIHYSNRAAMENALNSTNGDGVYAGRYVMVEYGIVRPQDLLLIYEKNGRFFLTSEDLKNNGPTFTATNDVMYRVAKNYTPGDKTLDIEIYVGDTSKASTLRKAYDKDLENPYLSNYLIDKAQWPEMGKGYDSTVWQKIYENGVPKYINIADLNSVVPTFGIKVDAPSQIPKAPHFDANLTNIYYDLHLQPAWGFRVKEEKNATLSDGTTEHIRIGTDGSILPGTTNVPAAIYFNKAAFKSQVNVDPKTIKKHSDIDQNYIVLEEAASGRTYSSQHDPTENNSTFATKQNDTQELSICLPAIGDMMSDAWDIIHGPDRDNSATESLQGRLEFFKGLSKNVIPVASTGSALVGASMSGDDWINTVVDADNKTITVTHKFTAVTGSNDSTNMNDATTYETIEVPIFTVDGMGHVTSKNTHTITLPYGFKTITPGASSTAVADGTSNTTSAVAEGTQDTLTITPSNKWVKVGGNSSNDTIYVGHQVNTITTTAKADTTLDGVGGFTVQDFTIDEAGHVTANQTHKYTLPHAVRNIKVDTTSSAVTPGTGLTTAATLEADAYNDTFTMQPQNRWVTLSADTTNDIVIIGHAAAGAEKTTAGDTTAATPAFGADFTTTYVNYDEMGHIVSCGTRQITLPAGSLDDTASSDTANVLTSIAYTPSSGKIAVTHQDVGTLKLTGYTLPTSISGTGILEGHSLNEAIGRLEYGLNGEITAARAAELALGQRIDGLTLTDTENNTEIITSVSQDKGQLTVKRAAAGTLQLQGYTTPAGGVVNKNDSLETAFSALDTALAGEASRAQAAEQALDERITNLIGGDISTAQLDTFKELSQALNDDTNFATTVNNAIANKANSADVYTKTEIDNDFAKKTDIPTDFYTKTEVDNLLLLEVSSGEETISGSPTEILAALLARVQALEVHHPAEEPTE